jgi:hypothetical protein
VLPAELALVSLVPLVVPVPVVPVLLPLGEVLLVPLLGVPYADDDEALVSSVPRTSILCPTWSDSLLSSVATSL